MNTFNKYSDILIKTVGLNSNPVGIKFFEDIPEQFNRAGEHRFCQLVIHARRGESLVLTQDDITCSSVTDFDDGHRSKNRHNCEAVELRTLTM